MNARLQPTHRPVWARYGLALLVIALGAALRFALNPAVGASGLPFVCFVPGIALAAWYGRIGPGIVATVGGAVAGDLGFTLPFGVIGDFRAPEWVGLVTYLGVGGCILLAIEAMHRAHAKAWAELAERRRSEDALRASELRERTRAAELETIMEAVPAVIFIAHDREARRISGNRASYEILRLPQRTNASLSAHDRNPAISFKVLVEGREMAPHELPVQRAARGESVRNFEEEVRFSDGTSRFLVGNAEALRDANGEPRGAVAAFVDITDFKLAQRAFRRSDELFAKAFRSSPEGLAICRRADGLIYEVNESWLRLFGLEAPQVIGSFWVNSGLFRSPSEAQAMLDTLEREGQVRAHQVSLRRADGEWRTVLLSLERLETGAEPCVLAIVHDVTGQRRSEEQLKTARDEALAANRAKDDFIALLSHELRTPLNPVLLISSDAANDPGLPESVRARFQIIANNAALEARLIDDLLDVNRITRGKLALEVKPVDLHHVIEETVAGIREESDRKRLRLHSQLEAQNSWIRGDSLRLRQVIGNVLRNSVKFTSTEGTITLHTRNPTVDTLAIDVSDTGTGMTPVELARAFDPFVQGEHARDFGEGYGGLGIGLAIARMLVERQGGQIRITSQGRGHGTQVTITLPALPADVPRPVRPARVVAAPRPEPSAKPRVLLVEDHAASRVALENLLRRRGYEVTAAASLKEARTHLDDPGFAIVVSDLGLPDGDGCELMAEIRQRYPTIFGIAFTGYGMESDLARCREAGFNQHLTKPVTMAKLDEVLGLVAKPVRA